MTRTLPTSLLMFIASRAAADRIFRAVHDAGFDVRLVVTNPDTRRGRGAGTAPSPVKAAALEEPAVAVADGQPAQHEAAPEVFERRGERGEAVMQPPATRGAERSYRNRTSWYRHAQ